MVYIFCGVYHVSLFVYPIAENFREVYISHFLRFDRVCKSLSCEFVDITILMHHTNTQITKLKARNVCSSTKSRNFMPQFSSAIRYVHTCTYAVQTTKHPPTHTNYLHCCYTTLSCIGFGCHQ